MVGVSVNNIFGVGSATHVLETVYPPNLAAEYRFYSCDPPTGGPSRATQGSRTLSARKPRPQAAGTAQKILGSRIQIPRQVGTLN